MKDKYKDIPELLADLRKQAHLCNIEFDQTNTGTGDIKAKIYSDIADALQNTIGLELAAIWSEVSNELSSAMRNNGPINSAHEGYAVIKEELEEYWDEVKKKSNERSKLKMKGELVQVAAMALRTILEVTK